MKNFIIAMAFALVAQSNANAHIISVYATQAEVSFNGIEQRKLVQSLLGAGLSPREDGNIYLSTISISGHSNSKDHAEPTDPCFEKPAYSLSYTYGQNGSANDGKTVTLNADQNCTGQENTKAGAAYNAIIALGAEGDAAMGGVFGVTVSELMCSSDFHSTLPCMVSVSKEVKLK